MICPKFFISCLLLFPCLGFSQEKIQFAAPNKPTIAISAGYSQSGQDFDVTSFEITGITPLVPIPAAAVPPASLFTPDLITHVENEFEAYSLRLDSWLFPFLNVYGAIGKVDGVGTVGVGAPFDTEVSIDFEGFIYGGGVNLLVGSEKLFLLTNVAYSITDMEAGDKVRTFNWRNKIGRKFGDDLTLWAGPTYQRIRREQFGTTSIPNLPIDLDFELGTTNSKNWNIVAGGRYQLNKDWSVTVEGGFAGRELTSVWLRREF